MSCSAGGEDGVAECDMSLHYQCEVVFLLRGGSAEDNSSGDVGGAVDILTAGINQ